MKASVIRIARFNAAHRLFKKEWTDEKNLEVFGACSHPNYHGHNYKIEVKVTGEIDEGTGFVMDLKILKAVIHEQVLERFDHRNLNLDVSEFTNLIPTAENIAVVIYNLIKPNINPNLELHIRLSETDRNLVEFPVV